MNYPVLIILLLLGVLKGYSQDVVKYQTTGFLDFNGYYDTRDYSVMTINILAKLPNRFQFFSLTNYKSGNKSSDLSSFYSEFNMRWQVKKGNPFDLTYQLVMRQGDGNDDHRIGVRWRLDNTSKLATFFKKLNMNYSMNPMLIQFRVATETKYMTQIEHVYKIRLYKDRIYLGGFADQNIAFSNSKMSVIWVTEHQLGVRIVDQFYGVVEYRLNDFLASESTGVGFGLEYKIKF